MVHLRKDDEKDTEEKRSLLCCILLKTEKDEISGTTPGSILKVDLDNTHPLMYGYPNYYYTLKMDNTIYDFMKEADGMREL